MLKRSIPFSILQIRLVNDDIFNSFNVYDLNFFFSLFFYYHLQVP